MLIHGTCKQTHLLRITVDKATSRKDKIACNRVNINNYCTITMTFIIINNEVNVFIPTLTNCHVCCQVYNVYKLPHNIRSSQTFSTFKKELRNQLLKP